MTPTTRHGRAATARTLVAVIALALLPACTPGAGGEGTGQESPAPQSSGETTTVAQGLAAPWSIAFVGRTPLVSERDSARILELGADGATREIAVVDDAAPGGEGGLLGIAVHEGHLLAYVTTTEDNRILRFPIRGEPGSLALGAPETLLAGIPAGPTHNGGRIAIGPDGMLYATTGDAGDGEAAQDLESLAGKILRLTPQGTIPPDNPFPDSPVFSYGHRNPQGMAWGAGGTMYASEFGQDTWDELNLIEAGGNYGWPRVEGIAGNSDYIDPVQQWVPAEASPSGIAITGEAIYLANLRGQRLREVPLDDLTTARETLGTHGRLRDVVAAPDGSLWVMTNNTDGRGTPARGDDRILSVRLEP